MEKGGNIYFKSVIWESHLLSHQVSFLKCKKFLKCKQLIKLVENSFERPLLLRHKVLTDE